MKHLISTIDYTGFGTLGFQAWFGNCKPGPEFMKKSGKHRINRATHAETQKNQIFIMLFDFKF